MLLAGDVGGTKTILGLFEMADSRPRPVDVRVFPTMTFASFDGVVDEFVREHPRPPSIAAVAIGVAGPVVGDSARLTNVPWVVHRDALATRFGTSYIGLLNDLEAMAYGIDVLPPEDFAVLQDGEPDVQGNAALIAAGTGLGQAALHRVNGRLLPVPSEAGHADFAARTDRELELVRMLRERFGRVEVEQVVSGPGLLNIHGFTHRGGACEMLADVEDGHAPARIAQAALANRCQGCVEALRMFVAAYGAEAGNLALRSLATAGVFIGGGIGFRNLTALKAGHFMDAFLDKAPMAGLLARIPVKVILNPEAALLGAAAYAHTLVRDPE